MANNFNGLDLTFMMIAIIFTFFACTLISALATYYEESDNIPDYIIKMMKYNLESTPIIDILSDDQCSNSDKGNVLGYYYGFDAGFQYNGKSYSEEYRKEICGSYNNHKCLKINAQREIPYRFYKGKRLCTSKRPNQNYFDYVKSSVDKYSYCPNGKQNCGKLDYNRNLCVKNTENCPINDIVYNNQSKYEYNGIKYNTVAINDNEYLHYTNKQSNNYIITNLTLLGGFGEGFPCGANDNNHFYVFSLIENNMFCEGNYKDYKYYFFKNLSTIPLEQFYKENDVDLSYLPEYKNLTKLENMTLFSTGFFSLSKKDIDNFESSTTGLGKNNKYNKTMAKCSFICFVTIIVLGGYSFFAISITFPIGNTLAKIIVLSISIIITLLIVICGLIEMIMGKQVFEMTGYVPKYVYSEVKDMKSSSGDAHFWAFLVFLIFQIPFLVILIIRCKRERKPKIEFNETSTNTPSNKLNEVYMEQNPPIIQTNQNDPYYNSTDFNYNPPPLPQNQPAVEYTPPQQNY